MSSARLSRFDIPNVFGGAFPADQEAVEREEQRDDTDDRDEPLLEHGISYKERRRDGDDAKTGMSDVLALIEVERALGVVEDAEETDEAERE